MSVSRRSWKGPVAVVDLVGMMPRRRRTIYGWPEIEVRCGEREILGQDGVRLVVPDPRGGRAEDKPEPSRRRE